MKQTVLITGAAKGIGKQIAIDFAKLGYNVCINYNKSNVEAKKLLEQLASEGYSVCIFKADVSNRQQVDEMVDYVLKIFGKIDVLVNNSGISQNKLFCDITNEDMQNMINASIIGTFNVTQSVLKQSMLKQKAGSIINISSVWGMVGASCEVHYSTVKAGIIGMTKALAKELAMSNICVNAVCPGAIYTDMMKEYSNSEIDDICLDIPLGYIGSCSDISSAVLYLASSNARYITGQIISPNGGLVI